MYSGRRGRPLSTGRAIPQRSSHVRHMVHRHNLDEFETRMRERLLQFRQDAELEVVLEPMSKVQRALVHAVARDFELRTQSSGEEPNRRIKIMKPYFVRHVELTDTQALRLVDEQQIELNSFFREHPLTSSEVDEHFRTDMRTRNSVRNGGGSSRLEPVVPPQTRVNREMETFRERLPTSQYRDEILSKIANNKVTIITGGTGCGKTTQVPQFLLEEAHRCREPLRIVCTQPRRLPAIAVAERVAKERGERVGDTVGYHIRLEQKTTANTALTYCTSGVLLRLLTIDDNARDITHIILDEVHEREQNTDYLLIVLRQALKKREDLKVILMSATMEGNKETFMHYFQRHSISFIEIPSRLHSVQNFYLCDVLALTGYMPNSSFGGLFSNTSNTFSVDFFPTTDEFREPKQLPPSQQQPQQPNDHLHMVRTVPDFQTYQHQNQPQSHFQPLWTPPSVHIPPIHSSMPVHPEELTRSMTVPANLQIYYPPGHMIPPNMFCDQMMVPTTSSFYVPQQQMPMHSGFSYGNGYPMQQMSPATPIHQMPNTSNGSYYHSYNPQQPPMPPPQPTPPNMSSEFPMNNIMNMSSPAYESFGPHSQRASDELSLTLRKLLPNRPRFFEPNYIHVYKQAEINEMQLIEAYKDSGGQQWVDVIDPDLTLETIKYCMDSPVDGAILVFLPGYDDIMTLREMLKQVNNYRMQPVIFTLHSQMNSQDQQSVFEPVRHGQRKVILSTNIAEASLTIDDVVFVIDCGKVKEKTYEHTTRSSQLKISWIARSNAEQRCGRAGRCRNGFCFRLYSKQDYELMNITQVAEMKRVAIHDVCLHAKMFAPDSMTVKRFLELAPEPPSPNAIDRSLEFLEQLGALFTPEKLFNPALTTSALHRNNSYQKSSREPDLTELGRLVAHLPLDPQLARLLLFGLALKCFHPVISLVAALSHREPFVLPLGEDRTAALAARDVFCRLDYSDHLMLIRTLNLYCSQPTANRAYHFCRQHFLSHTAMKMIVGIRRQLFLELRRLHLIPSQCNSSEDPDLNKFSHSWPMVQGAIVGGCYPGVAFVKSSTKLRKIRTNTGCMASLHPSSSLKRQVLAPNKRTEQMNRADTGAGEPDVVYLAYQELSKIEGNLTLRTVTAVPPMAVVLFAGPVRLPKVIVDDFELAEEDYDTDNPNQAFQKSNNVEPNFGDEEEEDDVFSFPTHHVKEYYVELEPWLGFRGLFKDLQQALRLRFKLMTYFLNVLKNPLQPMTAEHQKILQCVATVLEEDHKKCKFIECTDLFKQRIIKTNAPPPSRPINGYRPDFEVTTGESFEGDNSDSFGTLRRTPPSNIQPPNKQNTTIPNEVEDDRCEPPADPAPTAPSPRPAFDPSFKSKKHLKQTDQDSSKTTKKNWDEKRGGSQDFYRPPKAYKQKDDTNKMKKDKENGSPLNQKPGTSRAKKGNFVCDNDYFLERGNSARNSHHKYPKNNMNKDRDSSKTPPSPSKIAPPSFSSDESLIDDDGDKLKRPDKPKTNGELVSESEQATASGETNGRTARADDLLRAFGIRTPYSALALPGLPGDKKEDAKSEEISQPQPSTQQQTQKAKRIATRYVPPPIRDRDSKEVKPTVGTVPEKREQGPSQDVREDASLNGRQRPENGRMGANSSFKAPNNNYRPFGQKVFRSRNYQRTDSTGSNQNNNAQPSRYRTNP